MSHTRHTYKHTEDAGAHCSSHSSLLGVIICWVHVLVYMSVGGAKAAYNCANNSAIKTVKLFTLCTSAQLWSYHLLHTVLGCISRRQHGAVADDFVVWGKYPYHKTHTHTHPKSSNLIHERPIHVQSV